MVEKEEVEIDRSQVMKMTADGLEEISFLDIKKGQQIVIFNFINEKIIQINKFCAASDCMDGKVSKGIQGVLMDSEGNVCEKSLPSRKHFNFS